MMKPSRCLVVSVGVALGACGAFADPPAPPFDLKEAHFKNVTLEMSLKPFRAVDDAFVAGVCEELFRQWGPLTRHADQVSVLLWTADGSEILDYRGQLDAELEWARYIGGANTDAPEGADPEKLSLHQQHFLYMDNPPVITYGTLARIVATLKRIGVAATGKPVRVGATFDPGPEFARSPFKYERHREICMGNTMGKATFVCSYATLHADTVAYAGFPEGIAEGTPFGTFFGRQSQHFLTDLGFDYLWLSNGFGFGLEPWATTGAVFDGERFDTGRIEETRAKTLDFWRLFRAECPAFPLETRGTNLSTGMDLSADGVPLDAIYAGGFNMTPPPNSPWAALNGDFGLELIGYMSHIAEIPGEDYPFRYYTHDPWWLNSPWFDRYGREPHDIYLPMSVARIDATGRVQRPSSVLFLTVDNSFGEMPVECPNEVIPHILRARADAPDQPGPVVWVYPFDEYHAMTFGAPPRVEEVFFGDWFMRQAVNTGFPVNTVVSTRNFLTSIKADPARYAESVLVSIVPDAATDLEAALMDVVQRGGRVLLYGPIERASDGLLGALNLSQAEPLSGDFAIECADGVDTLIDGAYPAQTHHRPLTCAGGVRAALRAEDDAATHVIATVAQGEARRVIALSRRVPEWNGGMLAWVRGTNSNSYRKGAHLLGVDDPSQWFPGEMLMRYTLDAFGYAFAVVKYSPAQREPLVCVARNGNGFFFSGYNPNTTVTQQFRFPQGAPLLIGFETRLVNGRSTYVMSRAWHRECRVFVDGQNGGEVSCIEQHSGQYGVKRRLLVTGLDKATVRFYPEGGLPAENLRMLVNSSYPYMQGAVTPVAGDPKLGPHVMLENVTGRLTIAW